LKIAKEINPNVEDVSTSWFDKAEILKKEAGKIFEYNLPEKEEGVFPIIHCLQEIPCNPCSTICPTNSIFMKGDPIMDLPVYEGKCIGCGKCVTICPGLAITLADFRKDAEFPTITLPYEVSNFKIEIGDDILCVDIDGKELGTFPVTQVLDVKINNRTQLIKLKAPKNIAKKIVSFQIQKVEVTRQKETEIQYISDCEMVCICERVTAKEIRDLIHKGITDMNQIKAITRAGMGPCGAKSCDNLIKQIFRQEGVSLDEVEPNTRRPGFVEVPLGKFADGKNSHQDTKSLRESLESYEENEQ
ncbi:MAG: (2Fe-2S)-binding protein, partial [Candidatus Cloacimonetes bacterium]|nr:(2Fe-2S)-binding protein [Candidatus Cloacimonadota bacterium]